MVAWESEMKRVDIGLDHQGLAEQLTKGHVVGANAVADIIAYIDGKAKAGGKAACRVGTVIEIVRALLGRHGKRTVQRVIRLLLEEGILERVWPRGTQKPVHNVASSQLRRRLNEALIEQQTQAA